MCGEHTPENLPDGLTAGSSPHVRGAHRHQGHGGRPAGIIPACAGSTRSSTLPRSPAWDHPRMCGEHTSMIGFAPMTAGSSPHVRGARKPLKRLLRLRGIIPACAGSTLLVRRHRGQAWDHPRMCGEHAVKLVTVSMYSGSSPHVRGAPTIFAF